MKISGNVSFDTLRINVKTIFWYLFWFLPQGVMPYGITRRKLLFWNQKSKYNFQRKNLFFKIKNNIKINYYSFLIEVIFFETSYTWSNITFFTFASSLTLFDSYKTDKHIFFGFLPHSETSHRNENHSELFVFYSCFYFRSVSYYWTIVCSNFSTKI